MTREQILIPSEVLDLLHRPLGRVVDLGARHCQHSRQLLALGAQSAVCIDLEFTWRPREPLADFTQLEANIEQQGWTMPSCDLTLCLGIVQRIDPDQRHAVLKEIFGKTEQQLLMTWPTRDSRKRWERTRFWQASAEWLLRDLWPIKSKSGEETMVWYTRI